MDPSSSQCAASPSRNASDVPMVVDEGHKSPVASSPRPRRSKSAKSKVVVKSELTLSPGFRLSRLPKLLPRPTTQPITSTRVAISSHSHTTSIQLGSQDVPLFVNNSAFTSSSASRSQAHAHYLGPSGPSSPALSINHGLTQRRQRPRTSNLVFSPTSNGALTSDDLPKSLPPAPSAVPRQEPHLPELAQSQFTDFDQVKQNYINMLNQKNEVETTTEETLSPELTELGNVDIMSLLQYINQASPLLATPTPATPGLSTSPAFSELDDFDTPVIAEDDFLSGEYGGEALFPPMLEYADSSITSPTINYGLEHFAAPVEKKLPSAQPTLSPLEQMLYSFTPETPMLHDFGDSVNPAALVRSPALPVGPSAFPSPAQPASPSMAPPMNRRKSSATGTRKGLTPEALVPIDAPTQTRKYLTPSATSRKDLPATFARKRARSTAFGDEDEEHLEPLGPNATELEQIEYKRRQNTIAARRSRARKLQHQQELESRIENLSQDKDIWKERAMMCQQMLIAHGIPAPTFED